MSMGVGGTGRVESRELPQEGERGFVSFWVQASSGIQQDPKGHGCSKNPTEMPGPAQLQVAMWKTKIL